MAIGISWNPIFWTPRSGTRSLPQPNAGESVPYALNDAGIMAGTFYKDNRRRVATMAPGAAPNFFLDGTWAADSLADFPILDISNKGEVLGQSANTWLRSEALGLRAIEDPEGVRAFNRLNDSGLVVGYSASSDAFCYSRRAFIYDSRSQRFTPLDGGPSNLDRPHCGHYSDATAVNNKDQVVGHSNLRDGFDTDDAFGFIWSRESRLRSFEHAAA